jgi:hypothetical protein
MGISLIDDLPAEAADLDEELWWEVVFDDEENDERESDWKDPRDAGTEVDEAEAVDSEFAEPPEFALEEFDADKAFELTDEPPVQTCATAAVLPAIVQPSC